MNDLIWSVASAIEEAQQAWSERESLDSLYDVSAKAAASVTLEWAAKMTETGASSETDTDFLRGYNAARHDFAKLLRMIGHDLAA